MNVFAYRTVVTPRRLRLAYTSPPICEGDFSATGLNVISLQPLVVAAGPTGLIMEPYFGNYRLRWNTVPGALCYSIYRLADELNPFSPYILVAECIGGSDYLVGPGCYCVTAITPEGETECSNQFCTPAEPPLPPLPPYVPSDPPVEPDVPSPTPPPDIPGTCGDGSPPVPAELLEELESPEVVCETTANGATPGEVDFTMPSGTIAAKHVSGFLWDDCRPTFPLTDAGISNTWLVYEGEINGYFGPGFGCFGATGPLGGPVDCTPTSEQQMLVQFPDRILDGPIAGCGSCGDRTFSPDDTRVGQTWTFTVPGSVQAGSCPNGGSLTMQVVRTHAWIPQHTTLTISNFASIKDQLFCVSGIDDTVPQWDGVIGDSYMVTTADYQCIETIGVSGDQYVGDVQLITAEVRLVAGMKWTLNILVNDPVSGYRVAWSGEKRYGQTASGNYGRTGGCSSLGCVTLTP